MSYHNRRQGGFGGQRRNFSRRNQPKTIDPKLFVRAAEFVQEAEMEIKHSFSDFNLPPVLLNNVNAKGFSKPTPIQDQAIKPGMNGQDVLGLANTGTGKTIAFVLPLLTKLAQNPDQTALIVAPTRELAVQIRDETRDLSQGMSLYPVLLIGGANIHRQMQDLQRKPRIYIGTPGRLKDLHERRKLDLTRTQTVVLDEMDRMLDMGFVKDITYLLSLLPEKRQTLLFSATIDNRVEQIAAGFMRQPIKISVKTGDTARNVEQDVVRVSGKVAKVEKLHDLLKQPDFRKVLVFGRTKYGVESIFCSLTKAGFSAGSIHGNKRQNQRENTLRAFRDNKINVLVATDVAARGLDVKDITHVINFDPPESYEDYVHRIGRTGRAGKTGIALTFVE
jgi:superfamily II DNA/RNA helicase